MAKVFISYAWDDKAHAVRVEALAGRIRGAGHDVRLDVWAEPNPTPWPWWCHRQYDESDYVVAVCTPTYRLRVENRAPPGLGLGATFEGALIYDELYRRKLENPRIVPVRFATETHEALPVILANYTPFVVETDEPRLLTRLAMAPTRPTCAARGPGTTAAARAGGTMIAVQLEPDTERANLRRARVFVNGVQSVRLPDGVRVRPAKPTEANPFTSLFRSREDLMAALQESDPGLSDPRNAVGTRLRVVSELDEAAAVDWWRCRLAAEASERAPTPLFDDTHRWTVELGRGHEPGRAFRLPEAFRIAIVTGPEARHTATARQLKAAIAGIAPAFARREVVEMVAKVTELTRPIPMAIVLDPAEAAAAVASHTMGDALLWLRGSGPAPRAQEVLRYGRPAAVWAPVSDAVADDLTACVQFLSRLLTEGESPHEVMRRVRMARGSAAAGLVLYADYATYEVRRAHREPIDVWRYLDRERPRAALKDDVDGMFRNRELVRCVLGYGTDDMERLPTILSTHLAEQYGDAAVKSVAPLVDDVMDAAGMAEAFADLSPTSPDHAACVLACLGAAAAARQRRLLFVDWGQCPGVGETEFRAWLALADAVAASLDRARLSPPTHVVFFSRVQGGVSLDEARRLRILAGTATRLSVLPGVTDVETREVEQFLETHARILQPGEVIDLADLIIITTGGAHARIAALLQSGVEDGWGLLNLRLLTDETRTTLEKEWPDAADDPRVELAALVVDTAEQARNLSHRFLAYGREIGWDALFEALRRDPVAVRTKVEAR